MPLLRGRRDDGGMKYRMREKTLRDRRRLLDRERWGRTRLQGRREGDAYPQDAGARRPSGAELFKVQEKKLHIRDTMDIERGGETVARVKKALITPVRDRFSVEVDDGPG
jgi:hypothetical protein